MREALQKPADPRSWLILGWLCAVIAAAFSALTVWLAYLVIWRNPREFGQDDINLKSGSIFLLLVTISIGFSVLAFRLFSSKERLLSRLALRLWGTFFVAVGIVTFIHNITHKKWGAALDSWAVILWASSMAAAAFALARSRKKLLHPNSNYCCV